MTAGQLERALIDLIDAEGIHAVVDCLADACRTKSKGRDKAWVEIAWQRTAETLEGVTKNIPLIINH